MLRLQSALGIFALLLIAFALAENRRAVSLRQAAIGLVATFVTAIALLKLPVVAHAFGAINDAVGAISAASRAGSAFVFGYVGGGTLPFDVKVPGADFILAFQALPIVLVMSVLTTLLFYWRVLPPVVRGMAWLLERTLGVGGAVGLSTAANIFLGMVEAPLFVRPYLAQMSRSELFLVMTGGMAGIAGTVLVLYATLLAPLIPDAEQRGIEHLHGAGDAGHTAGHHQKQFAARHLRQIGPHEQRRLDHAEEDVGGGREPDRAADA